jgi:hypothetical protein
MPVMVPVANGVPVADLAQAVDFVVKKMPRQFSGRALGSRNLPETANFAASFTDH